jgi:hypothetical protein
MSLDYEEKRNFPRMRLNCEARFSLLDGEESFTGMALNLSGGGVLFLSGEPLGTGTRLRMRVEAERGPAAPLVAVVRVHRVEARPQGDYSVAAIIESVEGQNGP